jgi:hypothetical protein
VDQHLGTKIHKEKKQTPNTLVQQLFTNNQAVKNSPQENFSKDLTHLFVSLNIPLHKIDHPLFQQFFKTYCPDSKILSSSTLRKKFVDSNYISVMAAIKERIGSKPIWFSVDETTDVKGRYIANFVLGGLDENEPGNGYLINVKELNKTNNVTVSQFINECLSSFYLPEKVPTDKVLLMVTDAAPYMLKAAQNLKIFYPKLIHCTCLAHGLNRVAETIRLEFPLINSLVTNIKKVFIKAPLRVQVYREKLPGIPLPPEPVLTRWGTWLKAVDFISTNYNGIKEVISDFSCDSSIAIKKCVNLFRDPLLKNQLAYIQSNFVCIADAITNLETKRDSLHKSISIVNGTKEKISKLEGSVNVKNKFCSIIEKNVGFQKLNEISEVINGNFSTELDLEPHFISKFKFAPITSCDVERVFSTYKYILSDRRQSLTVDNIEKYLVIYCFNRNSD